MVLRRLLHIEMRKATLRIFFVIRSLKKLIYHKFEYILAYSTNHLSFPMAVIKFHLVLSGASCDDSKIPD